MWKSLSMKSNKPEVRNVIIIGYGGNCIDIQETLEDISLSPGPVKYKFVGFLDDNPNNPALGPLASWRKYKDCYFVNGIGSTKTYKTKEAILESLGIPKERYLTIVHPTAYISKSASIGLGSVIFQNVVITSNAHIGNQVMILPNSVVSHDSRIGDYSILAGCVCISGQVNIENNCYVGSNTSIKDGITVGAGALIGCGTNVVKDVDPDSINIGNPSYRMEKQ